MNLDLGYRITLNSPEEKSPFQRLYNIFQELITHTSGEVEEAIEWLRELDKEYDLTNEDYTIDDFIDELLEKGVLRQEFEDDPSDGEKNSEFSKKLKATAKLERALRKRALNQIFGKLKRGQKGNHTSKTSGTSEEQTGSTRPYRYGDSVAEIDMNQSLKNAMLRSGTDNYTLSHDDLEVYESEQKSQMSTVLMIDISHSMILYGEDRITPAKKVAMALSEMITTRFPKDTLEIIVFGNDAWPISIAELPYLKVGPYHTNTVAGLDLALQLLKRKKNTNQQIFMITDGKPSCLRLNDGSYYKNSVGLDDMIIEACYQRARFLAKCKIPITTFMIAQDTYLMRFIQEFTRLNGGKAFYTGLDDLGSMIFEDYTANRKRRL
jgi:Ca-activated chloride channel family protein